MTTIKAGTTSTTGFVVEADNTGSLVLQSGGSNDAVTFDSQTQQATFTQAISQPGAFMFRNKIINGNFDIWQRGTSQTSSGYGSADRWFNQSNVSTKTASRQLFTLGQTDVPNNPKYFMRHVVTSVAGASSFVVPSHKIEGVETLSGKTVTLSFWAKADDSKNIAIEFAQNFGTGGSPSTTVTGIGSQLVALTTSWTKYTITVDIPSISGKTLGTDANDFLQVFFWFDAGSIYAARSASLGQQSGTFDIAQVQLEEGSVATPFEQRPIGLELSLCQRYYQFFGSAYATNALAPVFMGTSTSARCQIPLATPLRGTPSIINLSAPDFYPTIRVPNSAFTGFLNSGNITSFDNIQHTNLRSVGLEKTISIALNGGIGALVTAAELWFDAEL